MNGANHRRLPVDGFFQIGIAATAVDSTVRISTGPCAATALRWCRSAHVDPSCPVDTERHPTDQTMALIDSIAATSISPPLLKSLQRAQLTSADSRAYPINAEARLLSH
jgi:hypothetical protein